MPQNKPAAQANLWPAAGITLIVFTLLILTGLVIAFGFVQQLSYLARERSLQEAESSLAAQKALLDYNIELKELLAQYNQNPLLVSNESVKDIAEARYRTITTQLPKKPSSVTIGLTNWTGMRYPAEITELLESEKLIEFRVIERIAEIDSYTLYAIETSDRQNLDLYSQQNYQRGATIISRVYILNSIAFEAI